MLTIVISLLTGLLTGVISSQWISSGWSATIGFLAFITVSIVLNRWFGKKLNHIVNQVQSIMTNSQQEVQKLVNRFQSRPAGSQKVLESQAEKIVENGILEALSLLDQTKPFYKWNILAERQINTLKMQLNFQIKRFDEVDRLLPKILVMDPMVLAMKMTRQYRNGSPDLEKSFRKGVKKFKYEKGTIIYALYAWIAIKKKDIDKALEVLAEAKEKIENETIHRNWRHVANNKIHLFSNAGLGDQWYTLHLEKPPRQKVSKGQLKGNPMAPKGKRRFG